PGGHAIVVHLDAAVPIAAIKVYGTAPYHITAETVAGTTLGFDDIDISSAGPGWHVFHPTTIVTTDAVQLTFESIGGERPVPELELWTIGQPVSPSAVPDKSGWSSSLAIPAQAQL